MKTMLVTGGAGFIGSHVVEALLATDVAEIVIYDNFTRGEKAYIEPFLDDPRCTLFANGGDIRDVDVLNDALGIQLRQSNQNVLLRGERSQKHLHNKGNFLRREVQNSPIINNKVVVTETVAHIIPECATPVKYNNLPDTHFYFRVSCTCG